MEVWGGSTCPTAVCSVSHTLTHTLTHTHTHTRARARTALHSLYRFLSYFLALRTAEYNDIRTETQRKFDEVQKEREKARIVTKAKLTHKEKVDKMNNHLATLSEHYDVPKVSWTK